MATITVRRVDPATWEPQFGNGQADYLSDIDAVAQLLGQRLKMFQGEWWANLLDGLPLWQNILGVGGANKSAQALSLIIQERILDTPFVTGMDSVACTFDPLLRKYSFSANVNTQFGSIVITNIPTVPSRSLP